MTGNSNPSSMLGRLRKVRTGLTTKLPPGTKTIVIVGVAEPVATVVEKIDEFIGIFQGAEDARENLTTRVNGRTAAEPVVTLYLANVQSGVSSVLGVNSQALKEKAAEQPSASNGGVSQGAEPTNGGTPTSPTPGGTGK